jgi:hypothetical protein
VSLKDGSFLYGAGHELRRIFAGGKQTSFSLPHPDAKLWRLLPTRRVDAVWAIWRDGRAELVQFAPEVHILTTLELPTLPFDVASNDDALATVRVVQGGGQKRRYTLLVLDEHGKELLSAELPGDPAPGTGEDWVGSVTRNKSIAMSSKPSLVAVGGPSFVAVWDVATGKQVFGAR